MTMIDWLMFGLTLLIILGGQTVLWTKFKTLMEVKVQTLKETSDRHEDCIASIKTKSTEAITMPQHDKIQADCRQGIYNDIDNITRSFDELRKEVKENNRTTNSIGVAIAGLRADLTHIGAVK